jgi:hypothetical protein
VFFIVYLDAVIFILVDNIVAAFIAAFTSVELAFAETFNEGTFKAYTVISY